ncbi:MAG: trypsin-like peptidase domain-containing protein [Alphaproteobacteria bacterium]
MTERRLRMLVSLSGFVLILVMTLGRAALAAGGMDGIRQAEALIDVGRFELASQKLKSLDVETPEEVHRLNLAFGRIFLALGKAARALEFYEKASFSVAEDAEAVAGMARAELALGHLPQARTHAEAALASDPGAMAAHLVLALVDERSGHHDLAMGRMANLARDMPDSEEVAVARADYTAYWDRAQAFAQVEDFVRSHPQAPLVEDTLGRYQWEAGHRDRALAHRRHAADLFSAAGNEARAEAIRAWIQAMAPGGVAPPLEPRTPPPQYAADPPIPPPVTSVPAETPEVGGARASAEEGRGGGAAPVDKPARPGVLPTPMPLPFRSNERLVSGSGIILEGGRLILTNHHVVKNTTRLAVRNGYGFVQMAKVKTIANDDDLALLEIPQPFQGVAGQPLSQTVAPKAGRAVLVMGFPLTDILGAEAPSLTEGIISKEATEQGRGVFQMTANINPGNSGGPIFDRHGNLLGVSVAMLDIAKLKKLEKVLVDNVFFGIGSERVISFVNAGKSTPLSGPELSPEALYDQMLSRVVLIVGAL